MNASNWTVAVLLGICLASQFSRVSATPVTPPQACWTGDPTEPWNKPAGNTAHPDSAALVHTLWNKGSDRPGNINLLPSYSVFAVEAATSTYAVTSDHGNLDGQTVPFAAGWRPHHPDGQIIVVDQSNSLTYEFFGAAVDDADRKISAIRADLLTPDADSPEGHGAHAPSRGIGLPYIHMLIFECEVERGLISHALSLRIARPRCGEAWFPAAKVENHRDCSDAGIPEGARFVVRIDPKSRDKWLRGLLANGGGALRKMGAAIADALETYGFYVTDNGGETAGFDIQNFETFSPESPIKQLAARQPEIVTNMLDDLFVSQSITAVAEQGPRLLRKKSAPP